MIEWKKYKSNDIPKERTDYLITDGKEVEVGTYYFQKFYPNSEMGMDDTDVTHYAEINLPE